MAVDEGEKMSVRKPKGFLSCAASAVVVRREAMAREGAAGWKERQLVAERRKIRELALIIMVSVVKVELER